MCLCRALTSSSVSKAIVIAGISFATAVLHSLFM